MQSARIFSLIIPVLTVLWGIRCWTPAEPVAAASVGFDPHAGYVAPYDFTLTDAAGKVIDLTRTPWQSDPPLPQQFVKVPDQNILLHTLHRERTVATDGSLDTPLDVRPKAGERAVFRIDWPQPLDLWRIYLKIGAQSPVRVDIEGRRPLRIDPDQSYQWIPVALSGTAGYLELTATRHFQLFEIAALTAPPRTAVTADLGAVKEVGTLYLRSAQGARDAVVELSEDGEQWQRPAVESMGEQQLTGYTFHANHRARYVRLHLPVGDQDWAKASLGELRIYDRYGPYGPPPSPPLATPPLRELLGVNGYWGWGANQYSYLQPPGAGPDRYAPVAGHARNYHDLTWDLTDPDERIDFSKMATAGTPANAWLDWDKEYRRWQAAGLPVQASLQFQRFEPRQWDTPYESAYAYGYAYARHFGPTHGNGLVDRVEVGNEPWHYPAALYRTILDGMSAGLKAADPALPVLPCALQAADPAAEAGFFKNYAGARLTPALTERMDGFNVHAYSYAPDFFHREGAVGPEHPLSTFGEAKNMLRWRDANAPGKPVYLSEWGYDYPGPDSDCTHPVCVSPRMAAAYALRTLFYAQRLGLERITWYYFADEEKPSGLYTRSGLTEEKETDFAPKAVYQALRGLMDRFGDLQFLRVLEEEGGNYTYLLTRDGRSPSHLVCWTSRDNTTGYLNRDIARAYPVQIGYRWQNDRWQTVGQADGAWPQTSSPTIYELKK